MALHPQCRWCVHFFDKFCSILTISSQIFRKPGFFRIFPNEGRSALQVWQVSILRWASRIAAKTAPFQVFRVFLTRKINCQNYRSLQICKQLAVELAAQKDIILYSWKSEASQYIQFLCPKVNLKSGMSNFQFSWFCCSVFLICFYPGKWFGRRRTWKYLWWKRQTCTRGGTIWL